jgi:hypothetical protein
MELTGVHSASLACAPGAACAAAADDAVVHVFSLTDFSLSSADFGDDAVLIDAAPPLRLLPPQPLSLVAAGHATGAGPRALAPDAFSADGCVAAGACAGDGSSVADVDDGGVWLVHDFGSSGALVAGYTAAAGGGARFFLEKSCEPPPPSAAGAAAAVAAAASWTPVVVAGAEGDCAAAAAGAGAFFALHEPEWGSRFRLRVTGGRAGGAWVRAFALVGWRAAAAPPAAVGLRVLVSGAAGARRLRLVTTDRRLDVTAAGGAALVAGVAYDVAVAVCSRGGELWAAATLDGAPLPILPANVAIRAMRVPAGRHRIEMR